MENGYQQQYSYGKRPLWQWILIYAVVGGIAYGLIYYFFFAKSGSYSYNSQQQNNYQATANPVKIVSPSNQNAATASVTMSNFAFAPGNITIHKGAMVTWKNNDSVTHTVTGDNGGPASQYISPGQSYSYAFTATGTFPYHCSIHPHMMATVTVID